MITQFLRWELNLVTPSDYLEEFVEVRKRAVIQDIILFIMLSMYFSANNRQEIRRLLQFRDFSHGILHDLREDACSRQRLDQIGTFQSSFFIRASWSRQPYSRSILQKKPQLNQTGGKTTMKVKALLQSFQCRKKLEKSSRSEQIMDFNRF